MTKLYPALVFAVVLVGINSQWPQLVELDSVASSASAAEDGFQGFFRYVLSRLGIID